MPVIDAIDKEKYGRLLAQYLPGVIRSDDENDRLAELLMKLALALWCRVARSSRECPIEGQPRVLERPHQTVGIHRI